MAYCATCRGAGGYEDMGKWHRCSCVGPPLDDTRLRDEVAMHALAACVIAKPGPAPSEQARQAFHLAEAWMTERAKRKP